MDYRIYSLIFRFFPTLERTVQVLLVPLDSGLKWIRTDGVPDLRAVSYPVGFGDLV